MRNRKVICDCGKDGVCICNCVALVLQSVSSRCIISFFFGAFLVAICIQKRKVVNKCFCGMKSNCAMIACSCGQDTTNKKPSAYVKVRYEYRYPGNRLSPAHKGRGVTGV